MVPFVRLKERQGIKEYLKRGNGNAVQSLHIQDGSRWQIVFRQAPEKTVKNNL
ncbi:MAG: hypothetical protein ACLQNE_29455 [Thermoguttaceae bacterium]|jgi:hypothetical protein